MVTRIIGLKEYRANLTKLWKDAQERDVRYVVMVRSRPVFEVRPVRSDEFVEMGAPVLRPLPDSETTTEIRAAYERSKTVPKTEFVDL